MSVLITPYILWFKLAPCSAAVVDFFTQHTVRHEGLGDVCAFALFNRDRDSALLRPGLQPTPLHATSSQHASFVARDTTVVMPGEFEHHSQESFPRNPFAKMEHSMINFKEQHPGWVPPRPAQAFFEQGERSQILSPGQVSSFKALCRGLTASNKM